MTNTNFENRILTNRVSTQMPLAKRTAIPGQVTTHSWGQQHTVPQMLLNFVQPILLQLVRKRNVNLSVTRKQDLTSWNFSFLEDPFSE